MNVCVHAKTLGTQKHLLFNGEDDDWCWVTDVPKNCWVYGDESVTMSLDVCANLYAVPEFSMFPENYIKCFQVLGIKNGMRIPMHMALPHKHFQQILQDLIKNLMKLVLLLEGDSYCQHFIKEREFLSQLEPAYVDIKNLNAYIGTESNPTVIKALQTFKPNSDGYTKPIIYDQTSTRTGRLIVKTGPQILTLTRKYRDILKSRYEGGEIWQIDFVSLEPRVARILSGHPVKKDIYEDIAVSLFQGKLKRPHVKLAVLCALYGISVTRLEKMLEGKFSATDVIRRVKEYFNTTTLLGNLRKQMNENGYMRNYFGRRLNTERSTQNILISHFLQSTACDAALLGFSFLLDRLKQCKVQFSPLCVIHDALLVDVHPDTRSTLTSTVEEGIELGDLGTNPVACSLVGVKK